MPELPEVETVRATLEKQIIGYTIKKVKVYCERIVLNEKEDVINAKLVGETIRKINRYGKYLIFILDKHSFLSHLRMEGKYFLKKEDEERNKHEHVIFSFTNGLELRYHDVRKFGLIKILDTTDMKEILKEEELNKLGPEAHSLSLNATYLFNKLHKLKESLKTALLDQTIICGLGNIYVDEVDFLSNLKPTTSCQMITYDDCENIIKNSRLVLNKAIEAGGTTIRSYTSSLGVTGRFQLNLNVHTKAGSPCPLCGTIIEKIKVGGRGTYYCPSCQKDHPLIVGLTGSIGSGKTTISNYLKEKGYLIIDTDEISRSLTKDNKEILNKIKEEFGPSYFINGALNRKELGDLVFNNENERNKLNNILHPVIKDKVKEIIRNSSDKIIFVDVPLLFESGFDKLCNKTICVVVDKTEQIKRLKLRDKLNDLDIQKRIDSQMDLKKKSELATFIIDNSQDLCYTYKQTDKLIKILEGEINHD